MQRTSTEAAVVPVSRHRSRLEQKLNILAVVAKETLGTTRVCALANLSYGMFLPIQKELVQAGVLRKMKRIPRPVGSGSFNLLRQYDKDARWKSRYILAITEKGILALHLHRRVKELLGESLETTSTT